MTFEELVKIFEDEIDFIEKYDNEVNFKKWDVPGGMILYSNQKLEINDDICLQVVCHGQTGWDNVIEIVPKSRKAKAARIAARRKLVSNIPKDIFDRSIRTRFGWEIVQMLNDRPELIRELLDIKSRPDINVFGNLSNDRFDSWVIFNQLRDNLWLRSLSGPRQESLLTILYGDWRKMPTSKQLLWKKYVIS